MAEEPNTKEETEYYEHAHFINHHNCMTKYVYTEHALNKVLKKELIKDLIRLHEQNHILRVEALFPNTIKYIEIIEEYDAINKNHTKVRELIEIQAKRNLDKVEEEKRLLILRIAELEEEMKKN
jgi:hypothetical protein